MAIAKLIASYDKKSTVDLLETDSAEREDPSYFDPLNPEGGAIYLKNRKENPVDIIDKSDLLKLQEKGKLKGRLKNEPPSAEYDHLIFDLTSYGDDAPRAWEIIRETLRSPDYAVVKNQGGGRFQDITIKGNRGIIDWGIHTNRSDGQIHAHILTHRYVVDLDEKKICPLTSMQTKIFSNKEMESININLVNANLAPLDSIETGLNPEKSVSIPKNEQIKIANAGISAILSGEENTLTALERKPESDLSISAPAIDELKKKDLMLSGLSAAKQVAARAAEEYQRATQVAAQITLALEAVETKKELENKLNSKERLNTELEEKIKALDDKNEELESRVVEFELKTEEFNNKTLALDSKNQELLEEIESIKTEFADVETERDSLIEEKEALESGIENLKKSHDAEMLNLRKESEDELVKLNETLVKINTENAQERELERSMFKEVNSLKEEKIKSLESENKSLSARFNEYEEKIKLLENANADLKNEVEKEKSRAELFHDSLESLKIKITTFLKESKLGEKWKEFVLDFKSKQAAPAPAPAPAATPAPAPAPAPAAAAKRKHAVRKNPTPEEIKKAEDWMSARGEKPIDLGDFDKKKSVAPPAEPAPAPAPAPQPGKKPKLPGQK